MERKQTRKSQLAQLKNNYLISIYDGLSKGDTVRAIHKKLYDLTIKQKKSGDAISEDMLKVAMSSVNSLKKKIGGKNFIKGYVTTTYGEIKPKQEEDLDGLLLSVFVFDLLHKQKIEKKFSHEITVDCDNFEAEDKNKVIADTIEDNRHLDNPKIFYLASQHKDSASDHKNYQGKMYIDEKWASFVTDKQQKQDIEKYISQNDVKTVQWVMGEPVWFITRPNCRHYFMALPVDEVLGNNKSRLINKYKMETAIGNRQYLQTIKHSTSKAFYDDLRNAQLLLEKYKERLELHKGMYASMPNDIIRKAISKDKMLIEKWQKYIDSRK